MNALELLHHDHEEVLDLLEDFDDQGDEAYQSKQSIVTRLTKALRVHMQLEEEIFYPAVRYGAEGLADSVKEDLEEHHLVKVLLDELERLPPDDGQYDAKVEVLKENVRHHLEEEEEELWPHLEAQWEDSRLESVGAEMEKRKAELVTRAGPDSSLEGRP